MISLVSAAVLTLAAHGAASAATVSFSDISGAWSNAVPEANVVSTSDGALAQLRWGTALTSSGLSGYDFAAASNPSVVVPPSPSDNFVLGTFSHLNYTIAAGTSITGADLSITANVAIDGVSQGTKTFDFHFTHDETPNSASPCPYGSGDVNAAGCADRVTVNTLTSTDTFVVGGQTYTVNIMGFTQGGAFASEFLTRESASNSADLIANVSLAAAVPEPSTYALMALGLAGLAGVARRRARG